MKKLGDFYSMIFEGSGRGVKKCLFLQRDFEGTWSENLGGFYRVILGGDIGGENSSDFYSIIWGDIGGEKFR